MDSRLDHLRRLQLRLRDRLVYASTAVPPKVDVDRDNLTESILPRLIGNVFNEFVGLGFGRRFREVTAQGFGGIDEIPPL